MPELSDDGETDPEKLAKRKNLNDAIGRINAKYGPGSIQRRGEAIPAVETISTGSLTLDTALGGGIPKGRIVEIFGPESSGKTTLALSCIAEVQARNGVAALIDAEHAFDPSFAKRMGVDVGELVTIQPDWGEQAFDVAEELSRTNAVDLIVIDSVSALMPRAELEGEMGQQMVGVQARMMSQGLRKLSPATAKSKCAIIFINQIRMKIGVMFGNPETTSGGNALKFYASARIEVRKKELIGDKQKPLGIRVNAQIKKNKVAPPFRSAQFSIMFKSGIDKVAGVLDAAVALGVVEKKAAGHYSYGEDKLGHGYDKVVEALRQNRELLAQIEAETRQQLMEDPELAAEMGLANDDDDEMEAEEDDAGPLDSPPPFE